MFHFKHHRKPSAVAEGFSSDDSVFTLGCAAPAKEKRQEREAMNCSTKSKRPGRRACLNFYRSCFLSCFTSRHLPKVKKCRRSEALTGNAVSATEANQGNIDCGDGERRVLPSAVESDSLASFVLKSQRHHVRNKTSVQLALPEHAGVTQTKVMQNQDSTEPVEEERWKVVANRKSREEATGELSSLNAGESIPRQKTDDDKTAINKPILLPDADFPHFSRVSLFERDTNKEDMTSLQNGSRDIDFVEHLRGLPLPAARIARGESVSENGLQAGLPVVGLPNQEKNRDLLTCQLGDFELQTPSGKNWGRLFHSEFEEFPVEDRSEYQYRGEQDDVSDEDTFASGEEPCDEKHTSSIAANAVDWRSCLPIDTTIFDLPGSLTESFHLCSTPRDNSRFCSTALESSKDPHGSTREENVFEFRNYHLECQRETPNVTPLGEVKGAFGQEGASTVFSFPREGTERGRFNSLCEKDERQRERRFRKGKRKLRKGAEEGVGRRRVNRIRGIYWKRDFRGRCGKHDMKPCKTRERTENDLSDASRRVPLSSGDGSLQKGKRTVTPRSCTGPSHNSAPLGTIISHARCSSSHPSQNIHLLEAAEHLDEMSQHRLIVPFPPSTSTLLPSSKIRRYPKNFDLEEDVPFSPSFRVFVSPEDTTGPPEGEAQRPLSCQDTPGFTPFASGGCSCKSSEVAGNKNLLYMYDGSQSLCSSGSKSMHDDEEPPVGTDMNGTSVFDESAQSEVPDQDSLSQQQSPFLDDSNGLARTVCVAYVAAGVVGSMEADTYIEDRENPTLPGTSAEVEGAVFSREGIRRRRENFKRRRLSLTTVSDQPQLCLDTLALHEKSELICTSTTQHRRSVSTHAATPAADISCSSLASHKSEIKEEELETHMKHDRNEMNLPSQLETIFSNGGRCRKEAETEKTEHRWTETERFISVVGEGVVNVLGRGAETLENLLVEKMLQNCVDESAGVFSEVSMEEGGVRNSSCRKTRKQKRPFADFSCSSPHSCGRNVTCSLASLSRHDKEFCKTTTVCSDSGRGIDSRVNRGPVVCLETEHGQAEAMIDPLRRLAENWNCDAMRKYPKTDSEHSSSPFCYIPPQKRLIGLQRPSSCPFGFPFSCSARLPTRLFPLVKVSSSTACISRALPKAGETGKVPCSVSSFLSTVPVCGKPPKASECVSLDQVLWKKSSRQKCLQRENFVNKSFQPLCRSWSSMSRVGSTATNGRPVKLDPVTRGSFSEFACLSWPADTRKSSFNAPYVNRANPVASRVKTNSSYLGGEEEKTEEFEKSSTGIPFDLIRTSRIIPGVRGQNSSDFPPVMCSPENKVFATSVSSEPCSSFSSFYSASPSSSSPYSNAGFAKLPGSSPPFASPVTLQLWPSGVRQMKQKRSQGKVLWQHPCSRPIPASNVTLVSRGCGFVGQRPMYGQTKAKTIRHSPVFLQRIQKPFRGGESWNSGGVIPTSRLILHQVNARVQPKHRFVSSPNPAPVAGEVRHRRGTPPGRTPQLQRIANCRRIKPIYTSDGCHEPRFKHP